MSFKKIFSYLLLPIFVLVPISASAQATISDDVLLAQINELLAQVEALQAQVKAQTGENGSFYRNLKIGDRGEDVKRLQIFLNSDYLTQIASFGPGSPGEETTYYGNLTAEAVSKFQELHRDDVLTPSGLFSGTGYFGPSTRTEVNEHIHEHSHEHIDEDALENDKAEEGVVSEEIIVEDAPEEIVEVDLFDGVTTTKESEFYIVGFSNYYVQSGDMLEIGGVGFSRDENIISFGSVVLEDVKAESPTKIIFEVPTLTPGIYQVTISNGFNESLKTDIVITSENTVPVIIQSIEPSVVSHGTRVTLKGSGFTENGNLVFLDGVEFRDLSSPGGEEISFVFQRPKFDRSKFTQDALDALGPAMIAQLEGFDHTLSPGIARATVVGVTNTNGRSNFFEATFK